MDRTLLFFLQALSSPRLPPSCLSTPSPPPLRLFSPASALLLKCNSLWDWLLQGRDPTRENVAPASGVDGGGGGRGGMSLDTSFFLRAMSDVNDIRGLGLRWNRKRMGDAAARAAASLIGSEVSVVEVLFLFGPAASSVA